MPVYRDANGRIVEEPPATQVAPGGGAAADERTRIRGTPVDRGQAPTGRTALVGRPASADRTATPVADAMADPVVGWLVVVVGPGRGHTLRLGFGSNGISRGPGSRLLLDFGDRTVSRGTHCSIDYDPRTRAFHLHPGTGRETALLRGRPVDAPTELAAGDELVVGATRLRFVPLCGPDFDWQDAEDPATP